MYFILHSDEAKLWLNRSTAYYTGIPLAVVLLVVSLVGSVMLYLSLAMSSAREDESGEHGVLERWTSYGIPITLGCYFRARRRGGGEKKRTQLGDLLLHVGDSIVGRIELAHAGRPAATHRLPRCHRTSSPETPSRLQARAGAPAR